MSDTDHAAAIRQTCEGAIWDYINELVDGDVDAEDSKRVIGEELDSIRDHANDLQRERDALRGYAQKMEAWVIRDTARLGGDTEGMANELREAAGVTSLLSHDEGEENDVALTDRAE